MARSTRRPRGIRVAGLLFTTRELLDLAAAWVAMGVAFTLFLFGPDVVSSPAVVELLAISMATVGLGFLLHELAHKVAAVRFGQVAQFRADYGMLFLAVMSGIIGFLFAAPGAVVHRGRITEREGGLIALAGPATNVVLALAFGALALVPALATVGRLGAAINAFLAAFNMVPVGPLDGRTVLDWSPAAFGAGMGVSLVLVYVFFVAGGVGLGI